VTAELSIRGLRAGYGPIEVLHGIDLDVPAGSLTALIGHNGAGKSTLLSVIAGLIPARSGSIVWGGSDIVRMPPHVRAAAGMLLIPERRGIFNDLSVRDNLEVFTDSRDVTAAAAEAFAAFPILRERLPQRAGSLSGGEQQMLAMSRALLRRPRLLLLDEISFGLAPRITRQLFDVVAELARSGVTVVMVEQYLADALRLADVAYVLGRGELTFAGEPAELTPTVPPS